MSKEDILLFTQEQPSGYEIEENFGMVKGNVVRSRNIGKDIVAVLRGLVGGEILEYTKLLAEAREQAVDRMKKQALNLGANAVVGVRFTTASVMQGVAEFLVYGTAVRLRKIDNAGKELKE